MIRSSQLVKPRSAVLRKWSAQPPSFDFFHLASRDIRVLRVFLTRYALEALNIERVNSKLVRNLSSFVFLLLLGNWGYDAFHQHENARVWDQEAAKLTQIEGQVFVVTKNGASLRLGSVRVIVLDKISFDKSLLESLAGYEPILDLTKLRVNGESGLLKTAIENSYKTSGDEREYFRELIRETRASLNDALNDENKSLASMMDGAASGAKMITYAKSDADGRFKLTIRKWLFDFYLFARAERKIDGQDEALTWLIEGDYASSPLLLSRDNIFKFEDLVKHRMPASGNPYAPDKRPHYMWPSRVNLFSLLASLSVAVVVWALERGRMMKKKEPTGIPTDHSFKQASPPSSVASSIQADVHPSDSGTGSSFKASVWIKILLIGLISLCGGEIIEYLKGNLFEGDITNSIARIVGIAFVPFALAMIFAAFIRGKASYWVGSIVAVLVVGIIGANLYSQNKLTADFLGYLTKEKKQMREDARSELESTGRMYVDATRVQEVVDTMKSTARSLPPTVSEGVTALSVVMDPYIKLSAEGQKIGKEIWSLAFMNPETFRNRDDLEKKLKRIAEYRVTWQKAGAIYKDFDGALQAELSARGISQRTAKQMIDHFVKSARPDIGIPLTECNVSSADALARQFYLLKDNFGRWHILEGKIIFDDRSLSVQLNEANSDLQLIAKKREALEQKLLMQPEP
jgi:hypothetical protein